MRAAVAGRRAGSNQAQNETPSELPMPPRTCYDAIHGQARIEEVPVVPIYTAFAPPGCVNLSHFAEFENCQPKAVATPGNLASRYPPFCCLFQTLPTAVYSQCTTPCHRPFHQAPYTASRRLIL